MYTLFGTSPQSLFSLDGILASSAAHSAADLGSQENIHRLLFLFGEWTRQTVQDEVSKALLAYQQQPVPSEDSLLTIAQIAEKLDVSRQTIHNWIRKNQLKAHKLGGRTYLKMEEVVACLVEKKRPDGTRKNARRRFATGSGSLGKEVAYA